MLGEENPHALTSMNNLALTLRAQGDLAGARALFEQALAGFQKVLGEDHPHTRMVWHDLEKLDPKQG